MVLPVFWSDAEALTWNEFEAYQWQELVLVDIEASSAITADAVTVERAGADWQGMGPVEFRAIELHRGGAIWEAEATLDVSVFAYPRPVEQDMLDYLPYYYQASDHVRPIITGQGTEIKTFLANITEGFEQTLPSLAVEGLTRWERILDIPTDVSKTVEERRAGVLTKLYGYGTMNKRNLKRFARNFYEVEIEEDAANHHLTLYAVGQVGIPPDAALFEESLRKVIPAHIDFTVQYTFTRWQLLAEQQMTWDGADTYTWNGLETIE